MNRIIRQAVLLAAVALLAQACAWGAVTVSWGNNTPVVLQPRVNPDYTGFPGLEPNETEWYGVLQMAFDTLDPVTLNISGNFKDDSGTLVEYIRLEQIVTNNTNYSWTDFHVVANDGSEFVKVSKAELGWNSYLRFDQKHIDFYGGPAVVSGDTFEDGFVVWAPVDANGDASFTLTKFPSVPEPASVTALFAGLAGTLGFIKKRKA